VAIVPLTGTVVHYAGGRDFMTSIESFVGSQNSDTFDASHVDPAAGITIGGAGGVDYITGSDGSDHLYGGSEGDTLWGRNGDDFLSGGTGDDTLYGDEGNDRLFGDDNDDWLVGGAGADVLDGGSGTNTADYSASSAAVNIQLERVTGGFYSHYTNFGTGSGGDAGGDTLISIQKIIGSNSDDRLAGDYHDNILSGGAGNDTLIGGGGNDTLHGGPGDDTLTGGAGLVAGASDSDTFVFQFYSEAGEANIGNDTITDFQHGSDILQFANLSSGQVVHVAQDHDNAVITFDHVLGSITLLNSHAADIGWIV
jgi:Ca2+-binding RTX toxin-like protein